MGSKPKARRSEDDNTLTPELSVETVMQRWPETVAVFQAYRTACVGCVMAPFDTLADVARNYHLEVGELLHALQQRIDSISHDDRPGP